MIDQAYEEANNLTGVYYPPIPYEPDMLMQNRLFADARPLINGLGANWSVPPSVAPGGLIAVQVQSLVGQPEKVVVYAAAGWVPATVQAETWAPWSGGSTPSAGNFTNAPFSVNVPESYYERYDLHGSPVNPEPIAIWIALQLWKNGVVSATGDPLAKGFGFDPSLLKVVTVSGRGASGGGGTQGGGPNMGLVLAGIAALAVAGVAVVVSGRQGNQQGG